MLNIRIANKNDLHALQELYLNLHETEILPITSEALQVWEEILNTPNYYILVGEERGVIISSITLIIIKNLTRKMRPYGLIENVVTAPEYRNKGHARCLIQKAVEIAKDYDCYKLMLMSSSKNESTIRFYINSGFSNTDKTGFVMRF